MRRRSRRKRGDQPRTPVQQQHFEEEPAEQAREHANRQKEVGPAPPASFAVERQAAAGHDHVQMRMVCHGRAPGMEHGDDADPGAQMLGIGGDSERGVGRRFEQEIVDHGFVLVGDVGDRRRQREHHVEVRHGQELGLAFGEPLLGGGALALGAMPVAAAVIGDDGVRTVLAARHMAAKRRRAAALDGRHHLQLVEADVAGIGTSPRRPWSRKISATSSAGRDMAAGGYAGCGAFLLLLGLLRDCVSRSSGLSMLAIMPVATRV